MGAGAGKENGGGKPEKKGDTRPPAAAPSSGPQQQAASPPPPPAQQKQPQPQPQPTVCPEVGPAPVPPPPQQHSNAKSNNSNNNVQANQNALDALLGAAGSRAKYVKQEVIGKGAFGEAYIVVRQSDSKLFVAKLMDLRSMSPKDKRYAQTEILCLANAEHFAIIQYVEHVVVDDDTVVIVMELADHGDLFNNLRKGNLQLTEREAGLYFVQLLLALDHIHRRRMIHRDIKSANVFMTSKGLLKLGDFGFSQQYDSTVSNPIAATFLGTPYYLAPEMWRGNRYGKKADMWAAGIVLYEMLTTRRPFVAQNMPSLKEKVLQGTYEYPEHISREMREVVQSILVQDPSQRFSAQQVLRMPIMQHYLVLLQKHAVEHESIDEDTRKLIIRNIDEGQEAIRVAVADEEAQGFNIHHESTVFKESDGSWKERYLILGEGYLTMTLARGKEAAPGADRAKKIPLDAVMAAVPVGTTDEGGKWIFAVSTTTSSAILMGTNTQEERDTWVTKLLAALEMN